MAKVERQPAKRWGGRLRLRAHVGFAGELAAKAAAGETTPAEFGAAYQERHGKAPGIGQANGHGWCRANPDVRVACGRAPLADDDPGARCDCGLAGCPMRAREGRHADRTS